MRFTKQSADVALLLEHFRGRALVRGHMGVGEILRQNRVEHIGAKRVAPLENHGAAGRAFGHRPGVAEPYTRARDGIDVRSPWWRGAAVAEDLHLIDTHIVHDGPAVANGRK